MTDDSYFDDILSDYVDKSPFPLDPGQRPGTAEGVARLSELASAFSCPVRTAAASVFAYALSRFIGSRDVVFTVSEDGRRFPIRVDCGDKDAEKFVSSVGEAIGKASATKMSF